MITKWTDYRFQDVHHAVIEHYSKRDSEKSSEFFI